MIQLASMGGLIWAESYNGPAQELDFTSMYATTLAKNNTIWPIDRGDFEYIKDLDSLMFGIYRVNIEGQSDKKKDSHCTHLFRYNPEGYHTHLLVNKGRSFEGRVNMLYPIDRTTHQFHGTKINFDQYCML
jgi:hypothetical protein